MTLDESLRGVAGVVVQYRRNEALGDRLMVRGAGGRAQFGIRGVRILVDGIPLTMPDGQSTLSNLDIAATGGAEVMRGPASTLYGNAAGGVLGFRTAFAGPGWTVQPELQAGSYGYVRGRFTAGYGTERTDALLSGGVATVDGYRRYAEYTSYRANLAIRHRLSDRTFLNGVLSFYDLPFAENPSSLDEQAAREDPRQVRPFIVAQGAGKSATQGQAGLSLLQNLGADTELSATGWLVLRDVWNPIPNRIIDLDRTATGLRTAVTGVIRTSATPIAWTAGVDFESQLDHRAEFENLGVDSTGRAQEGTLLVQQDENVFALSPFGRLDFEPWDRWTVSVAGRFDNYRYEIRDRLSADDDASGERTFRAFSPSAGIGFAASRAITVYASWTTAFTTPTTSELSNVPGGGGGFNQTLEPEKISAFELGSRGQIESVRGWFDLTGYVSRVRDALVPRQAPDEQVFFTNAGEVSRDGIELAAGVDLLAGLEVGATATISRRRFDAFTTPEGDFSGNTEPGSPETYVNAHATWLTAFGLQSRLSWRWNDRYPVNDANTASNPSWSVVDLSLLYRPPGVPTLKLVLGIDNLFGESYSASVVPNAFGGRYYEPSPGVEIYMSAAAALGGP
jgi:iron complex outermembrane receptor protein